MWDEIILGEILPQNQSKKYNIFKKYFSKTYTKHKNYFNFSKNLFPNSLPNATIKLVAVKNSKQETGMDGSRARGKRIPCETETKQPPKSR